MRRQVGLLLIISLPLFILTPASTPAQHLAHDWSQNFGNIDSQYGDGVATDGQGNVIVAGTTYGAIDLGGSILAHAGNTDVFLAKFDASGTHLWSQIFGDAGYQSASDVAVDGDGNIVVTGYFDSTVNFGGGALTSAGDEDIFIASFTPSGTHQWSQAYGDASEQRAWSVSVDALGAIAVTGQFETTVDFGGGTLMSAGDKDIFLAKLDASGNHLWSHSFGSPAYDAGLGVVTYGSGRVVVTGRAGSSINFGGGVISHLGDDIFVAKFSTLGAHSWSNLYGGLSGDAGWSIAVDGERNVLVTGDFRDQVYFGGDFLQTAGGINDPDIFVVKFSLSGTHIWSQNFGNVQDQSGRGIAADRLNNVFLTGIVAGSVDFGGGLLTSLGGTDMFVAKFDAVGNNLRGALFGDANFSHGEALAVTPSDRLLATGHFSNSIDFGGGPLASAGSFDACLASFRPSHAHIIAITDVPGDQGGWARIHFERSGYDTPGEATHPVLNYHVFRRVDEPALAARVGRDGRPPELELPAMRGDAPVLLLDGRLYWRPQVEDAAAAAPLWEAVATVPARQEDEYLGLVSTLADSSGALQHSAYFIMAQTTIPSVFFDSPVDSGYSVDNLSPAAPRALTGVQQASPMAVELVWQANTEPDLAHYKVYRGASADFVPNAASLIGSPTETTFTDSEWHWDSGYHYKVGAVDIHGNEGPHATLAPANVTGVGDTPPPRDTFLAQNRPNPFNPTTRITYDVKAAGAATLSVYDAAGRTVRVLASGHHDAGRYERKWDGRDNRGFAVASGVYFFRLTTEGETLSRKALLLK